VTQSVWRIATESPRYPANDLSGLGAAASGGRWNDVGVAIAYASQSRALACLETIVHLKSGGLPFNRYLVRIDIPNDIWAAAQMETAASLPVGWDAEPAGITSTAFGSRWVARNRSCLLVVPSAIIAEETNILINPAHPDSARIAAQTVRRWVYDPRLLRSG
jgi:RES domain-containing protein